MIHWLVREVRLNWLIWTAVHSVITSLTSAFDPPAARPTLTPPPCAAWRDVEVRPNKCDRGVRRSLMFVPPTVCTVFMALLVALNRLSSLEPPYQWHPQRAHRKLTRPYQHRHNSRLETSLFLWAALLFFLFVYFFKDRIVLVLCLLKILLLTLRVQYVMKWALIPIGITPDWEKKNLSEKNIKSMQLELLSVTLVGESIISWNQIKVFNNS